MCSSDLQSAHDWGCVVHWDTMPASADPITRPQPSLCTNPLTWRVDETMADASLNQGALPTTGKYVTAIGHVEDMPTGQQFTQLPAPLAGHTGAQCQEGSLFVPDEQGKHFRTDRFNSYHVADYGLFYMNIRNNAMERAQRFLAHTQR